MQTSKDACKHWTTAFIYCRNGSALFLIHIISFFLFFFGTPCKLGFAQSCSAYKGHYSAVHFIPLNPFHIFGVIVELFSDFFVKQRNIWREKQVFGCLWPLYWSLTVTTVGFTTRASTLQILYVVHTHAHARGHWLISANTSPVRNLYVINWIKFLWLSTVSSSG